MIYVFTESDYESSNIQLVLQGPEIDINKEMETFFQEKVTAVVGEWKEDDKIGSVYKYGYSDYEIKLKERKKELSKEAYNNENASWNGIFAHYLIKEKGFQSLEFKEHELYINNELKLQG